MDKVRMIDVRESILSDNRNLAAEIRAQLKENRIFMLNLMASPGAGKTSLIIETLRRLKQRYRFAVIEGDIESQVDADRVAAENVPAVQLRTGGACHLDAPMIGEALAGLELALFDVLIIENIGNLVCPAEALKYPLMFSVCDALVISKVDYLGSSDFDMSLLEERVHRLNPAMKIFQTSSKTGEGLDQWCDWLDDEINKVKQSS
ncbi:MAG: hypothetical protein AVO34_14045 [Firmicutes bacterium ML8_F2]|nr:MAG: hypothetical protein AVO34_14045 [Firmicutes bacterium ML8_F2]